jgi:hypothetical protein
MDQVAGGDRDDDVADSGPKISKRTRHAASVGGGTVATPKPLSAAPSTVGVASTRSGRNRAATAAAATVVDDEVSLGCGTVRLPTSLRAHCLAHLDLAALYAIRRVSRRWHVEIARHLERIDALTFVMRAARPSDDDADATVPPPPPPRTRVRRRIFFF